MTRVYFDTVAPRWEAMRETFFPDAVRRKAVAAARVAPGARALDVGAGSGFVTEALLDAGARVTAVDAAPGMVAALGARFGDRVEARAADATALPFADGAFDAAFANMCLHHVEDPALAVAEMARVVRPGGAVVITDLDEHGHDWLRVEHHDRWMGFARPAVAGWLHAAGLREVSVVDAQESCCASSSCGEKADVSIFLARGVR